MLVGEGTKRIDPSTRNIDTDISICHGSTPILVSGVGGGRPLPATVQGGQPFRKRLGRALSYATVLQDQGCIQGPARLPYDMDRSNKGAFRVPPDFLMTWIEVTRVYSLGVSSTLWLGLSIRNGRGLCGSFTRTPRKFLFGFLYASFSLNDLIPLDNIAL